MVLLVASVAWLLHVRSKGGLIARFIDSSVHGLWYLRDVAFGSARPSLWHGGMYWIWVLHPDPWHYALDKCTVGGSVGLSLL